MTLTTTTIDTPFGVFTAPTDDLVARHLREYGAHQRSDLAMLLSVVGEGDVVFDLGAHIGSFTIPLARRVGEAGDVFAIEPDPVSFDLLQRNIRDNGLEAVARPVQLVVAGGEGEAYVTTREAGNTGATGFRRAASGDVTGRTLDGWWGDLAAALDRPTAVDAIKVDVEGMEAEALRGAEWILTTHRPSIMVEVAPEQLREHGSSVRDLDEGLRSLGYHLFANRKARNLPNDNFERVRISHLGMDLGRAISDVLAVHPSKGRYPDNVGWW